MTSVSKSQVDQNAPKDKPTKTTNKHHFVIQLRAF